MGEIFIPFAMVTDSGRYGGANDSLGVYASAHDAKNRVMAVMLEHTVAWWHIARVDPTGLTIIEAGH
jgi:hypothetical protein